MKFIMNFLRSPFQFRSTDQSSNKSESTSPVVENMFIDPTTGISTDPRWRATSPGIGSSSSVSGSPRLQHRVPGFENNGNHATEVINEPSVSPSSNEGTEKSQRVRVVPIKVENVDDSSSPRKRPGAFHSSSGTLPRSGQFGPLHQNFEELHSRKRHSSGPASHKKSETTESKPKVCNIPIFIEGRDTPVVPKTSQSSQNVPVHKVTTADTQIPTAKQNGGNLAKSSTRPKQGAKQSNCVASLKQISNILSEFQALKTSVDEFKGSPQDKQYRYLDEMLTRCMLKLDNVETHGDDDVRASRKAAIKAVEKCINGLESHANAKSDQVAVDQGEEKPSSSELADAKEEEMSISQEQTVSEDTQKAEEMINGEASTSGGRESTETKPDTVEVVAESSECMDVGDVNQNSEGAASKSMSVDESGNDSKTLEIVAGATDLASQSVDKQTEPMDSDEVPEAKVKLDSEMEVKSETADSGTVKKPLGAENESSSVSAEVSN